VPTTTELAANLVTKTPGKGFITYLYRDTEGTVRNQDTLSFSVTRLIAENIQPREGNYLVRNPAGLTRNSHGLYPATYFIDAPGIADNDITWSATSGPGLGSVQFPHGNKGKSVTAWGTVAGDVKITATIDGLVGKPPEFNVRVFDQVTVPVALFVVYNSNGTPAISPNSGLIDAMFYNANLILRQAGISLTFNLAVHTVTNSAWFYTGSYNAHTNDMAAMGGYARSLGMTDVLKVFIVGDITNRVANTAPAGVNMTDQCIVIKTAYVNGAVLAHEAGHSLGWEDIYDRYPMDKNYLIEGYVSADRMDPKDWGAGHYPEDRFQSALVRRLLMHGDEGVWGTATEEMGYIPHGQVYGFTRARDQPVQRKCNVGLDGMIQTRVPKHP